MATNSATVRLFFVIVRRYRRTRYSAKFDGVRHRLHYNYLGERLSEHNYVLDLRNGAKLVQVPQGVSIPHSEPIPPPYVLVVDANRLRIAPGKLRRPPLA